jgi:heat shock protein HslJ
MAGREEAHIALIEADDGLRFTATVGCNRMGGGVAVDGKTLRLGPTMSTMMACPPPLDDQERQLAEALDQTTAWRLEGTRLELRDGNRVLAVMEAAYLR